MQSRMAHLLLRGGQARSDSQQADLGEAKGEVRQGSLTIRGNNAWSGMMLSSFGKQVFYLAYHCG